jgi:hypothetical protein
MIICNGIVGPHLPFISGNQWYFQNQYCYHSISFHSVPFIFSQMAISLMPAEDAKVKHLNITTKLKWKVFTKGIKMPSKEA